MPVMAAVRRLQALEQFIPRHRLLERLPDSDGHALWLKAPYGYGKSVLLAQWALAHEDAGRRVLWLSAEREGLRSGLALQLELPSNAPWPVLLDELDRDPSLVVVEEAEAAGEDLDRLLRDYGGLLAVASRGEPPSAELPRRASQARLTRLGARDLAFTLEESEALQAHVVHAAQPAEARRGSARAADLWRRSEGWALPLHLALLSGELPSMRSIVQGVSGALEEELRAELRLLAAVGDLPKAQATANSHALVAQGLAQELSGAIRLHPLVGEAMLAVQGEEVAQALLAAGGRLPWALRTAGLAQLGLNEALASALDDRSQLEQAGAMPDAWLAWHAAAPGGETPHRQLGVCLAQLSLTRLDHALSLLWGLLDDERIEVDWRLRLARSAVGALAFARRLEEAERVVGVVQPWLAALPPLKTMMWRHSVSLLRRQQGQLGAAEAILGELIEQASAIPAAGVVDLLAIRANWLGVRLEIDGDHEANMAGQLDLLPQVPAERRDMRVLLLHNLGINALALNDRAAARRYFEEALPVSDHFRKLAVRMALAYLEADLSAFPQLVVESRRWEYDMLVERMSTVWLRTCRALGRLDEAMRVEPQLPDGPYVDIERAWIAHSNGDQQRASELLQRARRLREAENTIINRDFLQHWRVMDFIVHGGEERLEALLALCPHQANLPALLLPLALLPRQRPELAARYPLEEVLASGWPEAIALRLPEVPPMELRLLGGFGLRVLGREVPLRSRPQQLLSLMALGLPRSRWAVELWPEADADSSENNLRVQLHQLRRQLEPWGQPLFLVDDGLQHVDSDLARLREALGAADADAVLRCWAGELTPDLSLEAVLEERRSLERRAVQVLAKAAEAAPAERAVAYLEKAMEIEPLDEELMRGLLQLLKRMGRTAAARKRLHDFGERLFAETGYRPTEATIGVLDGSN